MKAPLVNKELDDNMDLSIKNDSAKQARYSDVADSSDDEIKPGN